MWPWQCRERSSYPSWWKHLEVNIMGFLTLKIPRWWCYKLVQGFFPSAQVNLAWWKHFMCDNFGLRRVLCIETGLCDRQVRCSLAWSDLEIVLNKLIPGIWALIMSCESSKEGVGIWTFWLLCFYHVSKKKNQYNWNKIDIHKMNPPCIFFSQLYLLLE